MHVIMTWGDPKPRVAHDPSKLWYRRALGVDVRVRPDDTWAQVEVAGSSGTWRSLPRAEALALAGLTRWTPAARTGLSTRALEALIAQDAVYFAPDDPGVATLTGRSGLLTGGPIARRRSMSPIPALETAIEIAPFPFMPRGRELLGATLAGFRFGSRERGHEVFTASITGQKRTGRALRALLPALDGSRTAGEVIGLLDPADRAHGTKLLELLDDLTALTDEPVERWPTPADPRVTWLGHAGVLIESCGHAVLVDPLFFADSDPVERWASGPRFDPRTLPPLDLILITHGDNDHLNPASLAQLPAGVPVAIPKVRTVAEPWQVDLRGVLEVLGFETIHELDTWEHLEVGDLRVTACPFDGEDWGLELPKATWLVEGPEVSVYLAADAAPMPETWAWLADREQPVDLAFLGVSGSAEAMVTPAELGYGNFYEPWIGREERNAWVRHCSGPRESAEAARAFGPRFAFGYAAGGASYIQTSYSDVGDHAALAALLEAAGGPTRPVALEIGRPWSVPRGS